MHRGSWAVAPLLALGLLASACSDSGESSTPTEGKIGPQGGVVSATDSKLKITVPPGALTQETAITIKQTTAPVSGPLGPVYDIGPDGLTFSAPVTLTFSYSDSELEGKSASDLQVVTLVGQTWQPADSSTVDEVAHTISATTTHLSYWSYHIVGGLSSGCPQLPPGTGDFCQASISGKRCKWTDAAGIRYAYCDGLNWWTASTPTGCPVSMPNGQACGSYGGTCEYPSSEIGKLCFRRCTCDSGTFACVDLCACPADADLTKMDVSGPCVPWANSGSACYDTYDGGCSGPDCPPGSAKTCTATCTCVDQKWSCSGC